VLEVGEQSDNLSEQAPLKRREPTGRKRFARYWNRFAHAGGTKVAAHDLITERLLSKRRQLFKELDKDGNGYLTKEELKGHQDWLVELQKAREYTVLGGQGIQKKDIEKLLEEKADLGHDGKISFDEFVQVREQATWSSWPRRRCESGLVKAGTLLPISCGVKAAATSFALSPSGRGSPLGCSRSSWWTG
jgi:hypothetical protein